MELKSFDKLFYKLKQSTVPFLAQWELTTRCNLDCIHCCIKNEHLNGELTFEEIKDILYQLKAENCMVQRFSGGEPFLRKDFFKILELATKMQFAVLILSNGTLLDEGDAKTLKKLGIMNIQLSLYGATAAMHDSITLVKGSFDKTMNTIRLLKKHKVSFKIATMSFNKNFEELKELRKMAKKEKWDIGFDFVIFPAIWSSKDPVILRASDEQIKSAAKSKLLIWSNKKASKKRFRAEDRFRGHLGLEIGSSGKVFPSVINRMEAGDLRKSTFSHIWHRSKVFNYIRNLNEKSFECFSCKYYNKCCRNRDIAYLEQGSITAKPLEICRINQIFHKNKE
ncbi:MAG: radical SAM protein [Candidatus Omnitrophica bacterium]|nr:radical SAM protein [Candidatus Omnitrophota bacterium]